MKVFISYAHEQLQIAEEISVSLSVRGYDVFFDRSTLKPGMEYDLAIQKAIEECDLFVFLISPESVEPGRYTLTELSFAKDKWKNPSGRALPVMARPTLDSKVDAYLRAVTILHPKGNLTAEVTARASALLEHNGQVPPGGSHINRLAMGVGIGGVSSFVAGFIFLFIFATILNYTFRTASQDSASLYATAPALGGNGSIAWSALVFGALGAIVGGVIARLGKRSKIFLRLILIGVLITVPILAAAAWIFFDSSDRAAGAAIVGVVGIPAGMAVGMLVYVIRVARKWISEA